MLTLLPGRSRVCLAYAAVYIAADPTWTSNPCTPRKKNEKRPFHQKNVRKAHISPNTACIRTRNTQTALRPRSKARATSLVARGAFDAQEHRRQTTLKPSKRVPSLANIPHNMILYPVLYPHHSLRSAVCLPVVYFLLLVALKTSFLL
ncbi:unnamed protein product [Ectocarpus fasciculatus]